MIINLPINILKKRSHCIDHTQNDVVTMATLSSISYTF